MRDYQGMWKRKWTTDLRVRRDLCRASVDNLIILVPGHPAIEMSLKHLEELIRDTRSQTP